MEVEANEVVGLSGLEVGGCGVAKRKKKISLQLASPRLRMLCLIGLALEGETLELLLQGTVTVEITLSWHTRWDSPMEG